MFRGVFNRFISSKKLNLISSNRNYHSFILFIFNRTFSKCKNKGLVSILKMRNSITSNDDSGLITESKFHSITDDLFDKLLELLAPLENCEALEDLNYSMGVLTINLGPHGCWVLNKQTPNRQIWWSSPQSGPRRYEMRADASDERNTSWRYTKDGSELIDSLRSEINKCMGKKIV